MGKPRAHLWTLGLLCLGCSTAELPQPEFLSHTYHPSERTATAQMLWLLQHGKESEALEVAEALLRSGELEHEALEQVGQQMLFAGLHSGVEEEQLLTLIGASIAQHERCLEILMKAAHSAHPMVQIHALQSLAQTGTEEADRELHHALGSPWLPVRLTAANLLAQRRDPDLVVQIEAMLQKLPSVVQPYLLKMLAQLNTDASLRLLVRNLHGMQTGACLSALEGIRSARRDELAPAVREVITRGSPVLLEAAAATLGALGDTTSLGLLTTLCTHSEPAVRLSAALASIRLGDDCGWDAVRDLAQGAYLPAFLSLGAYPLSNAFLVKSLHHRQSIVRFHAALALLEQHDPQCLDELLPYLFTPRAPIGFESVRSPGGTHTWFRQVAVADEPIAQQQMQLREHIMARCVDLPEAAFLQLLHKVLQSRATDLHALCVRLLENLHTPTSVALIHQLRVRLGAPATRVRAALALYRLREEGPWEELLLEWIRTHHHQELIQLKPDRAWDPEDLDTSSYALAPAETSQLLLEIFEALAQNGSREALTMVLESMRTGHPRNRFVLAGILMRMAL